MIPFMRGEICDAKKKSVAVHYVHTISSMKRFNSKSTDPAILWKSVRIYFLLTRFCADRTSALTVSDFLLAFFENIGLTMESQFFFCLISNPKIISNIHLRTVCGNFALDLNYFISFSGNDVFECLRVSPLISL